MMIPVMEYEADVPQFSSLWYLPVLSIGLILALSIVHTTDENPWMATATALVYTLIRLGVVAFLWLTGFSLTLIPPLLLPALVFDLAARFRLPHLMRAVLVTLTVYLSFMPSLDFFLKSITITLPDVLVGLPLAAGGCWLLIVLLEAPHLLAKQLKHGLLVIFALFLLWPLPAYAHDPGQGQVIGTVRLQATAQQSSIVLTGIISNENLCHQLIPQTVEARRAGTTVTDTLSWESPCQFQGRLLVSARGRWFIYAELRQFQQPVETWLPVEVDRASQSVHFTKDAPLYLRETTSGSPVEVLSAVVLSIVIVFLFGVVLWVVRRSSLRRTPHVANISSSQG
jgi:hypothetical protein